MLWPAEEVTFWVGVELTSGMVGVGSPGPLIEDRGWEMEKGGR